MEQIPAPFGLCRREKESARTTVRELPSDSRVALKIPVLMSPSGQSAGESRLPNWSATKRHLHVEAARSFGKSTAPDVHRFPGDRVVADNLRKLRRRRGKSNAIRSQASGLRRTLTAGVVAGWPENTFRCNPRSEFPSTMPRRSALLRRPCFSTRNTGSQIMPRIRFPVTES